MGGKSSRDKGGAFELEVVKNHESIGIPAKKVPLSGASKGFPGDVDIGLLGLKGECKKRGNGDGFKTLERWMGSNDVLFLKRNRKPPLIQLTWEAYANLLQLAHQAVDADRVVLGSESRMEPRPYYALAHFYGQPVASAASRDHAREFPAEPVEDG